MFQQAQITVLVESRLCPFYLEGHPGQIGLNQTVLISGYFDNQKEGDSYMVPQKF